jgi:hypothetical protein
MSDANTDEPAPPPEPPSGSEPDVPKHARTETIPAVADRADDTMEHALSWGPANAYHGRRRAKAALLRGASRARLVPVAAALTAVLVVSAVLVWHRPPAGPGDPGADRPLAPGPPVEPTVEDSGSAPASASRSASGSRPPSRTPASASPSASPSSSTPSPTPSPSPSPFEPTSYEAESSANVISSGARVDTLSGASGGKVVYALGAPNLGVLRYRQLSVPATQTYTLTIYYQNPWRSTSRMAQIRVNGADPVWLSFSPTGTCCIQARTLSVTLDAGTANTIEFANPNDRGPDIDRIVISK